MVMNHSQKCKQILPFVLQRICMANCFAVECTGQIIATQKPVLVLLLPQVFHLNGLTILLQLHQSQEI